MKIFRIVLLHHILTCAVATSSDQKIIERVQSVELIDKDDGEANSFQATNDNNHMYLYQNYLNYRAVYGLRYSPTKKPTKDFSNNYNIISDENTKPAFNKTISNEVISSSNNKTEDINDEYSVSSSNSVESETSLQSETSSENLSQQNFTSSYVEPVVDESRKHIMRPNNRVEHALDFLAERLKKLMYHSADKSRPESKLSPHLTSLGRFLNLFSLIKFENIPCLTAMKPLRQLMGTCYNEVECMGLGGIAVDRCANGFGVCCIFRGGCNSVTHQNVTYFESPNYPLASQRNLGICTLTILLARKVKQILVEFLFFEILPPTDGNCIQDKLVVSGQAINNKIPEICGTATGQHMFIDVDGSDTLFLNVITTTADDRAFSIKVTQLRDNLSPQGCFQYYTNSEGIIKTFNYDDYSQTVQLRRPSYFNNLNYSICIRRSAGYCTITYTNELKGREDVFELVNLDDDGNRTPGNGQAGAEIFNCQDDFIAVNFIRLCGSKLNDGSVSSNFNMNVPVLDYINGPIVIPVKTNNETVGRGFKIYFFQLKCLENKN